MSFWTWSRGLEDAFDGTNRRNLRHFLTLEIHNNHHPILTSSSPTTIVKQSDQEDATADAFSLPEKYDLYLQTADDSKMSLTRIPTCAIFHKMSAG